MNELYAHYRPQGVEFLLVYVREPHPGEHYGHHTSFGQKARCARDCQDQDGVQYPMLVDDLAGTVHRRYGSRPNAVFVIDKAGIVVYRALWTQHREIREVLDSLLAVEEWRREGRHIKLTYAEKSLFIPDDTPAPVRERVFQRAGPRSKIEWEQAFSG